MKQFVMAAVFLCSIAGAAPRYTANECRAKAKVGDEVRLEIAYFSARRDGGRNVLKGYVMMTANTYHRRDYGGTIEVAIPEKAVDYYTKRIGLEAKVSGHRRNRMKVRTTDGVVRMMTDDDRIYGNYMYVELELPKHLEDDEDKEADKDKEKD